nr:Mu phage tail tube protein GpM [Gammaproteobacteria bacterium]
MAKNQITGRAIINWNGKRLRSENGATLNPGGASREAKTGGGQVHGYMESDVPPSMECTVFHDKSLSLRELSDITDATVTFETDTGSQYILRDAWTTEPVALDTGNGTVGLKMEAISCDEV